MKCDRCGKTGSVLTMSMFNTQMICMDCKEEEMNHEDYERARAIELGECRKGNLNYKGVGLPKDLKEKYEEGKVKENE